MLWASSQSPLQCTIWVLRTTCFKFIPLSDTTLPGSKVPLSSVCSLNWYKAIHTVKNLSLLRMSNAATSALHSTSRKLDVRSPLCQYSSHEVYTHRKYLLKSLWGCPYRYLKHVPFLVWCQQNVSFWVKLLSPVNKLLWGPRVEAVWVSRVRADLFPPCIH